MSTSFKDISAYFSDVIMVAMVAPDAGLPTLTGTLAIIPLNGAPIK